MPKTKTARQPPRTTDRHGLSYQLREIIASRGLTAYAVAKLAGIDPGVVSRFLSGERDIRLETADRIAAALGLRLVEVARAKGRARVARPAEGQGRDEE
jgi:transcriptional regulator with XRE-family HTH domain